jgi:RNA polymerase sigma factor (sigma-70 family)
MAPRAEERGPEENSSNRLRELAEEAGRTSKPAPDERRHLLEAAAEGDGPAQDRLFRSNLEMVIRQAAARGDRGLSVEELVQEGSLGLIRAIRDFADSGREDFEAFARDRVGESMEAALREEEASAEEALKLVADAESYDRAEAIVRRDLGRQPTDSELAQKLEWTAERTHLIGELVKDARRRHDEELVRYLDPGSVDLDRLLDGEEEPEPGPDADA